jgi:hypothetical protein
VKEKYQSVVTLTAWTNMKNEADSRGISVSELIEGFGWGLKSPLASPIVRN